MKKNYIYAFATVFIWSTMNVISKILITGMPALELLSAGSLLAFITLLILNVSQGVFRQDLGYKASDYAKMSGLGFIGLFLYSALYYQGIDRLTSQEACIINYLWPIMVVIFSCILLKERLTIAKIFAMLCSFAGIIILTFGGTAGKKPDMTGVICCLVAAACYGLFSVLNKQKNYNQQIAMMIIWLTTFVCSTAAGLLTETWIMPSAFEIAGFAWMGIIANAFAYLMWALALNGSDDSAVIANIAYLTPFVSVLLSAVILHEEIHANAIIALILIVGGILVQSITSSRRKHPAKKS